MTMHRQPCFCTDCLEARDCGAFEEEFDQAAWQRAFPNLDWEEKTPPPPPSVDKETNP